MNRFRTFAFLFALSLIPIGGLAQTNPLWHGQKIKNYLPHMTRPEVEDLLQRTDMALIPVPSLEQHGLHLPIGTDFLSGIGRAQLIAQETDVLVAPVLFVGNAPLPHGLCGHDDAVGRNDSAGLLRGGTEFDAARLQAFPDNEQSRRKPGHFAIHRRPHQP